LTRKDDLSKVGADGWTGSQEEAAWRRGTLAGVELVRTLPDYSKPQEDETGVQ
jgi:hypothetical protein